MEVPRLADLVKLDDTALMTWRREARTEMEHDPDPALRIIYDQTTQEVTSRAREMWTRRADASDTNRADEHGR